MLSGRIEREEIPALCGRLLALAIDAPRDGESYVILYVSNLESDLTALDALARLRLTAQRAGHDIRLHGASLELRRLIALAGLLDVLLREAS